MYLLVSYFSRFFLEVTLKTSILSVDQFSFTQSAALLVIGITVPVQLFSHSCIQSVIPSVNKWSICHFTVFHPVIHCESASKSCIQLVILSVSHSVRWSFIHFVSQSVSLSVSYLLCQSVGQLFTFSVIHSFRQPVRQLVSQLFTLSVSRSVIHFVSQSVISSASQSVNWNNLSLHISLSRHSLCQPVSQSVSFPVRQSAIVLVTQEVTHSNSSTCMVSQSFHCQTVSHLANSISTRQSFIQSVSLSVSPWWRHRNTKNNWSELFYIQDSSFPFFPYFLLSQLSLSYNCLVIIKHSLRRRTNARNVSFFIS